jgi:hypothetical protein
VNRTCNLQVCASTKYTTACLNAVNKVIQSSEQCDQKSVDSSHTADHPVACRPTCSQLCRMERNFFFANRISEGVLKFASLQPQHCTGAQWHFPWHKPATSDAIHIFFCCPIKAREVYKAVHSKMAEHRVRVAQCSTLGPHQQVLCIIHMYGSFQVCNQQKESTDTVGGWPE